MALKLNTKKINKKFNEKIKLDGDIILDLFSVFSNKK